MARKHTNQITAKRVAIGRVISLIALAMGFRYLFWRLDTLQGVGLSGIALYFAEVVNYLFTVLTVFLFWQVEYRTGPPAPPFGTLDIFIPVCGEPTEVVERTLQAALAIRFPHETYILNDGRRAGKENWAEIETLAGEYGVPCFTRTEGPPRKAGNLNHALRSTHGQFVAVIDADHVVEPHFAEEVLGYFADEKVGLVATPQRVHTDRFDILGNNERFFYSYIQPAKDATNSAFSCGSGVVYRRTALESIEGFSEWNIVEDLHTSYRMHAQGWRSVYHPRALTIGLSPGTGAELVSQRLGWATDSLRLFFWDNPARKRGLSLMQRLNYLHIGGFYLVMVTQLIFFVTPVLHLLWDIPILRSDSIPNYVLYAAPYFGLLLLYVIWLGGFQGGLRAIQKGIFLAPTFLLAAIRAATGINFASPVTEKGRQKGVSLLLLPQYLALALLLAGIVKGLLKPNEAKAVSVLWAAWMASALAIPVLTLGLPGWRSHSIRLATRGSIAVASLLAASVFFLASRPPMIHRRPPTIVVDEVPPPGSGLSRAQSPTPSPPLRGLPSPEAPKGRPSGSAASGQPLDRPVQKGTASPSRERVTGNLNPPPQDRTSPPSEVGRKPADLGSVVERHRVVEQPPQGGNTQGNGQVQDNGKDKGPGKDEGEGNDKGRGNGKGQGNGKSKGNDKGKARATLTR